MIKTINILIKEQIRLIKRNQRLILVKTYIYKQFMQHNFQIKKTFHNYITTTSYDTITNKESSARLSQRKKRMR